MSQKLKDVHSVRIYQAVKFENKLQTFFTTLDSAQRKGIKITIEPSIGVLLESDSDAVIVPFPNISGIYLHTAEKTAKHEAHIEDISKPAKAQTVSKSKVDPIGAKRF
jgi:hypothetical protein